MLSNAKEKGKKLEFHLPDWSLENTDLTLKLSNWDMDVTSLP